MRLFAAGTAAMAGAGVLIAALSGCGGGARAASLSAEIDSTNGVRHLKYPGDGGASLAVRSDTVLRIGDVMGGDDAYQFDRVPPTGLAGDASGNIFVLDIAGVRVLEFDAQGKHKATFGRKGEGPGELAQPFSMALGAADTVWVLDPLNGRITGFPPAGDPRVVTLTGVNGLPTSNFAVLHDGFLLQVNGMLNMASVKGGPSFSVAGGGARVATRATTTAPAVGRAGGGGGPAPAGARPSINPFGGDGSIPVFRLGFNGVPGDTLWRSTPPVVKPIQMGGGGNSRTMTILAAPEQFRPLLRWAAFSDGSIVTVDTDAYDVNVVGPDGKVRFVITRDMAPWPVTDKEKEWARDQVRNRDISLGGGTERSAEIKQMMEQMAQSMTFAETVPRIAKVAVDTKDRIWVGVSLATPGEVDRVDLYEKDGRFIGSLNGTKIPDAFLPDGRMASLVKDPDTDVQRVAVYRITEGTER